MSFKIGEIVALSDTGVNMQVTDNSDTEMTFCMMITHYGRLHAHFPTAELQRTTIQ